MITARKTSMCQRCGHRIDKGAPIRFESYQTKGGHRFGSGRAYGGGETKSRPIHAHDCAGIDAMQAQAKAAAEAASRRQDEYERGEHHG